MSRWEAGRGGCVVSRVSRQPGSAHTGPEAFKPPSAGWDSSSQKLRFALAVLLNVNKWIYFTLRIQAQINIREYEVAEMMAEEREDQERMLKQMKQQSPDQTGDFQQNNELTQTKREGSLQNSSTSDAETD